MQSDKRNLGSNLFTVSSLPSMAERVEMYKNTRPSIPDFASYAQKAEMHDLMHKKINDQLR